LRGVKKMSLVEFLEGQTKPRCLTDWLEKNYSNKRTKEDFHVTLKNWIKCFYGEDSVTNYMGININQDRKTVKRNVEGRINEIEEGIERYLNELDNRDFTDDYKKFINWLRKERFSDTTILRNGSVVKTFFTRQDPRCKINDEDWFEIKRTLLPKSKRAATQDKILTKEQLKKVLQHISIQGKAGALFLLSTGARIGEALQLKMSDINLDLDPPEVNIRNEYTKGKVGGRVMWFSEEARDAIKEWHNARLFKEKPGRSGSYDINRVFNINASNFTIMWNKALKRADGGRNPPVLAKRDPSTRKRIHVYHVHTLRKFFSTNMRQAGVPPDTVHAWMGHQGYLTAAYDRPSGESLSEIYKGHMGVVTVYEVDIGEKARIKYKETIERAEKLAEQTIEDRVFLDMMGGQLDAFVGLSEEEKEALSLKEKKNLIIYKVAQLKVDLVHAREQSVDELEKALKQVLTTKKAGGELKSYEHWIRK